jgi:transketolase
MKKQHPTDPNLFWCPKCKGYKTREEFGKTMGHNEVRAYCLPCEINRVYEWRKNNPEKVKASHKRYRENHKEYRTEYTRKWQKKNPEKQKEMSKIYNRKMVDRLKNCYLIQNMKYQGIFISPETIELKRQQITLKRNLKKLRRLLDGPTNESIEREQQQNGEDNRREVQSG